MPTATDMYTPLHKPIRILIVDDHPVVCSGLTNMLSTDSRLEVIGSSPTAEEALASVKLRNPHVLLVDLRMPGMGGIGLLERLKQLEAAPLAIVLTSFEKDEEIYRAIRAGARGYLLKDTTEAEIISAIIAVDSGERYIPRRIAAHLTERMLRADLTERELSILELLSQGSTNKEIAKMLLISDNTVRHHVKNIMDKLQASDRTEAVAMAIRSGVIAEQD